LAAVQIRHDDFSKNTNRMEISISTTSDVATLVGASNVKISLIAAGCNSRYSSSQSNLACRFAPSGRDIR
jgi:hypothetical protein